jgi:hypothetical protein
MTFEREFEVHLVIRSRDPEPVWQHFLGLLRRHKQLPFLVQAHDRLDTSFRHITISSNHYQYAFGFENFKISEIPHLTTQEEVGSNFVKIKFAFRCVF